MSIEALERQPCEDCIRRSDAINAMSNTIKRVFQEHRDIAEKTMNKLPPVTPQPKMGHWIRVDKDKCKCDQCEVISFIAMYPNGDKNYCPNCGAKMEVEE